MIRILTISILSALILSACNGPTRKDGLTVGQSTKTNIMTYPVKNISISINKSADEVYRYASNPENLPKWVGFVESMIWHEDRWIAKTDLGAIEIKWPETNDFGVIDHQVTFTDGGTVNNPMRVVPNKEGCEFIFTLFRMPNRTEEEFDDDAAAVVEDLQNLKEILER